MGWETCGPRILEEDALEVGEGGVGVGLITVGLCGGVAGIGGDKVVMRAMFLRTLSDSPSQRSISMGREMSGPQVEVER